MADPNLDNLECKIKGVLGEKTVRYGELKKASLGTIIELDSLAGEPCSIEVNGEILFKGEVVVVDENFGLRITEILE